MKDNWKKRKVDGWWEEEKNMKMRTDSLLTILGLKGGCTSRFSTFSQSMRRKKLWFRTSSSPFRPHPNRFVGFLVRNCVGVENWSKNATLFNEAHLRLYKRPSLPCSNSSDMTHCGRWWLRKAPLHPHHQKAADLQAFRTEVPHMPNNQRCFHKADTK